MDAFRDAGRPVKWDGQRQLQRAMTVLGESPTFLGLREVSCERNRFDDMQHHSEVSRQVLADRSATLVAHDTLAKIPINQQEPGHDAVNTRDILPTPGPGAQSRTLVH